MPDFAPLANWRAESLRLTVFPSPGAVFATSGLWQIAVGEEPESLVHQPRKGEIVEAGEFQGGDLSIRIQLGGKHNWRYSASASRLEQHGGPWLGSFPEAVERFAVPMLRWLEVAPPLQRIGFGGVVILQVEGERRGYEALAPYIPAVRIDERMGDLLFRVNRRRASRVGVPHLEINRIGTWSMVQYVTFEFEPAAPHPTQSSDAAVFACQLEFDVNTMPEFEGELPADRRNAIFEELIAFARDVTQFGDRDEA